MSYEKLVEDILNALQKKLRNKESQKRYLVGNSSAFARKRSLPFNELTAFLFQRSTYSLDKTGPMVSGVQPHQPEPISRQAISKARQKFFMIPFYYPARCFRKTGQEKTGTVFKSTQSMEPISRFRLRKKQLRSLGL